MAQQPYNTTMSWAQLIGAVNTDTAALYAAIAGIPAGATGANPTAKVAAAAVNGVAGTFMRSDAAPPIDLTISATWIGNWIFTPAAGVTQFNGLNGSGTYAVTIQGGTTAGDRGLRVLGGSSGTDYCLTLVNAAGTTNLALFYGNGSATLTKGLGVNGAAPPTQVTGWGTPTGAAVVANFNGATGTLVNCSTAIAELITILKAAGIIGA
jgi:hypothetical protein